MQFFAIKIMIMASVQPNIFFKQNFGRSKVRALPLGYYKRLLLWLLYLQKVLS
jgi:hypothetical protein